MGKWQERLEGLARWTEWLRELVGVAPRARARPRPGPREQGPPRSRRSPLAGDPLTLTDPLSLGIAAAAGAVAVAIGWLQWPRPPTLDGERWFKIIFATLLRGRMSAADAPAEDWEREVLRIVPYHPAGRLPERKLSNPAAAVLPGAALDGEIALIEALAKIPDPKARAAFMYDDDPIAADARFSDPADLGERYDPKRLGPGATWDSLAAWGAGDRAFLEAARRAVPARWVLLRGREGRLAGPSLIDALAAEIDDAVVIPWSDGSPEAAVRAAIGDDVSARAICVAEEAGTAALLGALADAADLRDLVLAVVSIGGVIGGRTDEEGPYGTAARTDWVEAHFNQLDLDTEVVRATPYLAVQWLDRAAWPPGVPGLPLQASRFPEPKADGTLVETVEVVDLGPLPADRPLPTDLVARALIAVVSGWVRSRQ